MNDCPIRYALNILSGKWKIQIMWELSKQEIIRFNELKRRIDGVSSFMLSKALEELEQNKIINRKQYNEIPPHVEYSLTKLGRDIEPAINLVKDWGIKVFNEINN